MVSQFLASCLPLFKPGAGCGMTSVQARGRHGRAKDAICCHSRESGNPLFKPHKMPV
ncbi:hypothetical protein MBAV_001392 [Candidatus Magnetobacterium bavaricum]|uniref:Uncharacterized protein n=1 Tax=Candidatus Magnetobacterium bavaricum TaxID=29290 RepID=A0A0F3GX37_9BACT|nr:hypothetical protein MBAV_001392 [Candidatus Magnetobacterium bavaricum]